MSSEVDRGAIASEQRSVRSFCRLCTDACGMIVTVENGRVVAATGDAEHATSRGYACARGRRAPQLHNDSGRLLHPVKRAPDGSFQAIAFERAITEIAERLRGIIDGHGPDAVAVYRGTHSWYDACSCFMLPAWLSAIGSTSQFSTHTIDQSAKSVTADRLGTWSGGRIDFREADVIMMAGTNPLVSRQYAQDPTRWLKSAKAAGQKLIVVDPRRTETARHADLFLQPYPGEDPTLAAGLLQIILAGGLEDSSFCARYVDDLPGLRAAVMPFMPAYVADRAGVEEDTLVRAAELFACAERSVVITGTGVNFGPRSNLSEHLYETLNVVCGRLRRAGERVTNPGVLTPARPFRAEVVPPTREWERTPKSRVRGLGRLKGEKMTTSLADEILTPGASQIKALINDGGNPGYVVANPSKAVRALKSLELLVTVDPFLSNTALLSDYVIPPTLMYERADIPLIMWETNTYAVPFAQYTPAVASTPPGSDIHDAWFVYWSLARELGVTMFLGDEALDMSTPPTPQELLTLIIRDARVSLSELAEHPGGMRVDVEVCVQPGQPEKTARFEVIPADVREELMRVAGEAVVSQGATVAGRGFPYRLASRRVLETSNTEHHDGETRRRLRRNPARLNPDDLNRERLANGDRVRLVSPYGEIETVVEADRTVRRGVVSIAQGWGAAPDDAGALPNFLISDSYDCDPINWMPTTSGVRLRIEALT